MVEGRPGIPGPDDPLDVDAEFFEDHALDFVRALERPPGPVVEAPADVRDRIPVVVRPGPVERDPVLRWACENKVVRRVGWTECPALPEFVPAERTETDKNGSFELLVEAGVA